MYAIARKADNSLLCEDVCREEGYELRTDFYMTDQVLLFNREDDATSVLWDYIKKEGADRDDFKVVEVDMTLKQKAVDYE